MLKLYHGLALKQIILVLFLCSCIYGVKLQAAIALTQDGELKLGIVGSFNSFTPYSLVGTLPEDYYFLVYDSLMVESLDKPDYFQPLLAEAYKITGNNITFNLNKKAAWSNGEKVNADSIIYTFNIIKKFGAPYFKAKLADIQHIKKVNNYTIEFELKEFDHNIFKLIVALPIIYEDAHNDFITPSLDIPIASGAYIIEKYQQGNFIVYKKNPNYWGKNLLSRQGYFNFERIYYHYAKTQSQIDRLYKNSEITFKKKLPADRLGENDEIFLKPLDHIPNFKAYFLNTSGVFADINLRKIVADAYNFQKAAEYFLTPKHVRLTSLFENTNFKDSSFIYSNEAKLTHINKPVKLKILFKNAEDYKISQDFINNLRKIGFEVVARILPFYDYLTAVKENQYDIIMENLVFAYFPQDELISYFSANGEYNYSHINNSKVQILIDKITSKENKPIKEKHLKELDLFLKNLYIFIPLYYESSEEYVYKNWLAFNQQQAFSIYRWWHK
ncbi:MAG: ABC transporter substrate-binding protein [Alphaproteobacteria bacterium]|nr:ABC transporter substrate-binding protein [Alphaproteobacteria bacterium]